MSDMLCIFCTDNNHLSQNCNIYSSNEARLNILRAKNLCLRCLTPNYTYSCCDFYRKCYVCFTRSHHTVYCTDRFKASKSCPPNFDSDLLPRFLKMLTFEEKYSMIFLWPNILNTVNVKPITISSIHSINLVDVEYALSLNSDVIAAIKGSIVNEFVTEYYATKDERISTILKQIAFRINVLEFQRVSISSNIFFHFLSLRTTKLECTEIILQSKITFAEILLAAPNLEIISLRDTNIEFSDSWPDQLLQFNHSKQMKRICFSVPNLRFSAKSLSDLMMTKSVAVSLSIRLPPGKTYNNLEVVGLITSTLCEFFDRGNSNQPLRISVSYACGSAWNIETDILTFKNVLFN